LYLISIGITITNIIQSGLTLATRMFIELNPIGYGWHTIIFMILFYLWMSIPFFIKDRGYKGAFFLGIIYTIFIGFGCFVHDFMIINITLN